MTLQIQHDIDLLPYNTFHFSCIARSFVEIQSPEDLQSLITHERFNQTSKKLILGGGSNLLLATGYFDGLVIKNAIHGRQILSSSDTEVLLVVGSGELRNDLVRWTLDQGRVGLENLVSIPGTVGAAPVQNIGAYGVEAKSCITAVIGIDTLTGEEKTYDTEACQFGYRTSLFKTTLKENFFITKVIVRLHPYHPKTYEENSAYEGIDRLLEVIQQTQPGLSRPLQIATAIDQLRASKLPDWNTTGTAGSFFQNPVISTEQYNTLLEKYPGLKGWPAGSNQTKLSAGQLIEIVGFKGYTEHGVGVYEKHALILVNHTATSGTTLMCLIQTIIDTVHHHFSLRLVPEVIILQ